MINNKNPTCFLFLTKFLDCGGEQKRVDQKLKHLGEVEQVKQKTKALQEKVPPKGRRKRQ